MNTLPNELKRSIDDLRERAVNGRLEAEYFESLGLDVSAAERIREAREWEAEADQKQSELAGFGAY